MTTFKKGDRVRVVSADTFNGATGTINDDTDPWKCREIGVFIDGEPEINFWFNRTELRKSAPKPQRRLTIKPTKATTKASFDDMRDGWSDARPIAADTVVIEGDFEFEVEEIDQNAYVQVKTGIYSRLTYIDPSADLAVGDEVVVPVGTRNKEQIGTVVDLGRGVYTGKCKAVVARVTREAL